MISFLYLVTDIAGITLLRTQILFTITTYIEIVVYVGMPWLQKNKEQIALCEVITENLV